MWIYIVQNKGFDALNATHKTSALCEVPFLIKLRKKVKIVKNWKTLVIFGWSKITQSGKKCQKTTTKKQTKWTKKMGGRSFFIPLQTLSHARPFALPDIVTLTPTRQFTCPQTIPVRPVDMPGLVCLCCPQPSNRQNQTGFQTGQLITDPPPTCSKTLSIK